MSYDTGNQVWKFNIHNEKGQLAGLIQVNSTDRSWIGQPKDSHFETLYKTCDELGIWYFVLYRFSRDEYTDKDYCRILTTSKAAEWLNEEGYLLPDDLKEHPESNTEIEKTERSKDSKTLKSKTKGNYSEKKEWTRPLGLKKWAEIFSVHPNTMSEWLKSQNICNEQVSPRRWRVDVDELPTELVKKVRVDSENE